MLKAEIIGLKGVQQAILRIKKRAEQHNQLALADAAEMTMTEAKLSIQARRSKGKSYRTKNKKILHIASAANNPPNTDTGNLVKNIKVKRIQGGYDVGSRTAAPYGAWLEFGTKNMSARPWLMPAYNKIMPAWKQKYMKRGLVK